MAFKVNLPTIRAGASYKIVFRWYTESEDGVRTPVELAGFNGRLQLRDGPGGEILADWSTSNGMLVFSDVNKIKIDLPRSETDRYEFESAVWDMVIWPGSAMEDVEVLIYGEVPVERVITDIA